MKTIFALLCLVTTSSVKAHDDHLLGEGLLHVSYHLVFWSLCALVAYKGVVWFKNKKSTI
jgi:hypothetical protein